MRWWRWPFGGWDEDSDGTALSEARVLVMEVFVPTGSARAFRMMPIHAPLADRIGVTRQTMVLAYTFGHGFPV